MKSPARVLLAGVAVAATVGALAGCSAGDGGADSGKTELRVATFPPGADAAAYEAFAAQEKQFEEENPDIDIVGVEYEWEGPTFAVQLAGGSLPDVFTVPFTDSKTLVENGQLMDVTEEMEELGYTDSFNPIILDGVTDSRRPHLRLPAPGVRRGAALQPRPVRGRPGSTPTTRRRRGTRCARRPRRSPTRPARPATRRWPSTTRAAGS